ncbi:MAG: histidine kinase [Oscillospiraceae bacterium]|nr:histidine kinase [Oscillospiraceae bacterium]
MIRMEAAMFLALSLIAMTYFFAGRKNTKLHRTFSVLLIVMLIHLIFDAATVYTVNHMDIIPQLVNDILHKIFIGTMILCVYLFYEYIATLVEGEAGIHRKFSLFSIAYLVFAESWVMLLPVRYKITSDGNYSAGIHIIVCYVSLAVYITLCVGMFIRYWKDIDKKKKTAIGTALVIEITTSFIQALNPTWLISGMGMFLMTLAFYLTLENPEILRSELTEQKMSMLYLKSQVNPHFLYNTLDTIRIQAQLGGDKTVSDMLMRLTDFFRLSVKVDRQMVPLDDELDLSEAYVELMCCRYPEIKCSFDIDPELGGVLVPNFILQPIVENSFIHGLKNKSYRGEIKIIAKRSETNPGFMEIQVVDSGGGFDSQTKENLDEMLLKYNKQKPKLEGNSIGVLNVQKRIKLLLGRESGLRYTENRTGGVTAHLLLKINEKECIK